MKAGDKVTDGYFLYTVLAVSHDEIATLDLHGHQFRIPCSQLFPN